jgi:hypothetical protein
MRYYRRSCLAEHLVLIKTQRWIEQTTASSKPTDDSDWSNERQYLCFISVLVTGTRSVFSLGDMCPELAVTEIWKGLVAVEDSPVMEISRTMIQLVQSYDRKSFENMTLATVLFLATHHPLSAWDIHWNMFEWLMNGSDQEDPQKRIQNLNS